MAEQAAPPFECVLSADLFSRALAAVSIDEARYYLRGVHVEPCAEGGALLVSTDGRRLLVLRDKTALVRNGSGTVTLTKPMVKALTAKPWQLPSWTGKGGAGRHRFLAVRGNRAAVIDIGGGKDFDPDRDELLGHVDSPSALVGAYQWLDVLIDGAFPDWRKVIGVPGDGGATGYVDVGQLQPIVQALSAGGRECAFRLAPTKDIPAGPVFIVPYGPSLGFAVIMPLNGRSPVEAAKAPEVPSWLHTPPGPKAEAA